MTRDPEGDDYDYIIRVIQYLDRRHGIRFFISSKDFDVLYHWWEKHIPETVIHEALDRVVERCRSRRKPVDRFSIFTYEVRRNTQSFLSLGIGGQRPEPADEHAGIKKFLAEFPPVLEFMKADFEALCARLLHDEAAAAGPLQEKLLTHFNDDNELNAKAAWFLKNLSPPLRRPDIERKYRLNYLSGKFAIPAWE
jgi:hypothetical protein